jgi:hypothetical protein
LRNSVKSSALFNEALETILLKLLRPVVVYKATDVRLYESMRAGVGLVTRVGSMEGGDDAGSSNCGVWKGGTLGRVA